MEHAKSKQSEILSKFLLQDRVAIVTGAGGGIGKGIALAFAGVGANVVVSELVASRGEGTAQDIRALGRKSLLITMDATKSDPVQAMVDKTLAEFGQIDIMVNNIGGTFGNRIPFWDIPDDTWDSVVNQNLRSTFLCSKMVSRVMIKQKRGVIINLASMAGHVAWPGMAAYPASKAGILHLTRTMALALAPYGIRVNSISPGSIETSGTSFLGDPKKRLEKAAVPLGRIGQPEDIAMAALYLASDAASYVTGANLNVAGGKYLGSAGA